VCVPVRAGSLAFGDYAFLEARIDASNILNGSFSR
jgi:hypothetical protein